MVNKKQQLDLIDYFGPLIAFVTFFTFVFIVSFFVINYCCVRKPDDYTVFEEWGHKHRLNVRLGPHRVSRGRAIKGRTQSWRKTSTSNRRSQSPLQTQTSRQSQYSRQFSR